MGPACVPQCARARSALRYLDSRGKRPALLELLLRRVFGVRAIKVFIAGSKGPKPARTQAPRLTGPEGEEAVAEFFETGHANSSPERGPRGYARRPGACKRLLWSSISASWSAILRAWRVAQKRGSAAARPHAKTHKSAEIARQITAGAWRCVAKLGEAEALAGIELLITSPVVAEAGIERLTSLNLRVGALMATSTISRSRNGWLERRANRARTSKSWSISIPA